MLQESARQFVVDHEELCSNRPRVLATTGVSIAVAATSCALALGNGDWKTALTVGMSLPILSEVTKGSIHHYQVNRTISLASFEPLLHKRRSLLERWRETDPNDIAKVIHWLNELEEHNASLQKVSDDLSAFWAAQTQI